MSDGSPPSLDAQGPDELAGWVKAAAAYLRQMAEVEYAMANSDAEAILTALDRVIGMPDPDATLECAGNLEALLARVDDLERERDEADGDWAEIGATQAGRAEAAERRLQDAEAEVARLTAERDEWMRIAKVLKATETIEVARLSAERRKFQAEAVKLRTALSEICVIVENDLGKRERDRAYYAGQIARAALSGGAAE